MSSTAPIKLKVVEFAEKSGIEEVKGVYTE